MTHITPKVAHEKAQVVNKSQATTLAACLGEPLKVLITRPKDKAEQLASLLNEHGINSISQTLFDYQANANTKELSSAIENADIIIFVSVAAVEFTHASYPLTNILSHRSTQGKSSPAVFAVGNATKQALLALGLSNVLSPPAEQEHSEGLLQLAQLANVKDKNIIIVRGNGGREHIANTLRQRGATVNYIESYQRVWRILPRNTAQQWREQQINCIVVTSNDILVTLTKYLFSVTEPTDNYWQSQCVWIVVSERIEKNAKALGLIQIINAQSANSQLLCKCLQTLSC
ncbi:uroporphyrinogen-III synthase [Colwellia sp. E2M01]|uniref:uroporphyrinogen-III synthase n=1 Tax=Colwellia sp. E2M01 TaxID=2841561 RepID=UPI001C08B009|nr:uroporphyrinogen-III synthase [Colwellia sp. E2M01]MBU2871718.1 uroporphyrinogen-III synthase [Colwellia sp. E2M01]